MEKKKVTLSLEKDVVDQAKKQDLNMSKAANKALKERTVLEKLSEDERELRDIIEDARENGAVESLPMKIEGLQIENIGKFEEKNFSFSSEDTVILGPNSSGKTTITRALKAFFGEPDQDLINFQENSGKIEVETEHSSGSMTISKDQPVQGECLVLDNIFAELSTEKAVDAAQNIKENYSEQIILTTSRRKVADEFKNQIRLTSYSEDRLAELREKLNKKNEELQDLQSEYSELADKQEELEEEYEELVSEKSRIKKRREHLEELNERIEDLTASLDEKKMRVESLEEEISEAENDRELGKLEAKKEQAEKELEELEEEIKELKKEKEGKKEVLDRQDDIEDELNSLKMKKERNSQKIAEIKDRIEALREEKTHLESEIEEVQDKL